MLIHLCVNTLNWIIYVLVFILALQDFHTTGGFFDPWKKSSWKVQKTWGTSKKNHFYYVVFYALPAQAWQPQDIFAFFHYWCLLYHYNLVARNLWDSKQVVIRQSTRNHQSFIFCAALKFESIFSLVSKGFIQRSYQRWLNEALCVLQTYFRISL